MRVPLFRYDLVKTFADIITYSADQVNARHWDGICFEGAIIRFRFRASKKEKRALNRSPRKYYRPNKIVSRPFRDLMFGIDSHPLTFLFLFSLDFFFLHLFPFSFMGEVFFFLHELGLDYGIQALKQNNRLSFGICFFMKCECGCVFLIDCFHTQGKWKVIQFVGVDLFVISQVFPLFLFLSYIRVHLLV